MPVSPVRLLAPPFTTPTMADVVPVPPVAIVMGVLIPSVFRVHCREESTVIAELVLDQDGAEALFATKTYPAVPATVLPIVFASDQ